MTEKIDEETIRHLKELHKLTDRALENLITLQGSLRDQLEDMDKSWWERFLECIGWAQPRDPEVNKRKYRLLLEEKRIVTTGKTNYARGAEKIK